MSKDIFVSNSGNDSNDGFSLEQSKETISAGVSLADDGDFVWIEDGEYSADIPAGEIKQFSFSSLRNNNNCFVLVHSERIPIRHIVCSYRITSECCNLCGDSCSNAEERESITSSTRLEA